MNKQVCTNIYMDCVHQTLKLKKHTLGRFQGSCKAIESFKIVLFYAHSLQLFSLFGKTMLSVKLHRQVQLEDKI